MNTLDRKALGTTIIRALFTVAMFILISMTLGADYGYAHVGHDLAKPDIIHTDPDGKDSGAAVEEEICCYNSTSTACWSAALLARPWAASVASKVIVLGLAQVAGRPLADLTPRVPPPIRG